MWGNVPKGQKGRASSKMEGKLPFIGRQRSDSADFHAVVFLRNRIYENHVLINPQNAYRNNAFGMRFFICNFSEKLLDKSQNLCYNQSTV